MNEHDSERMKGMLESLGYTPAAERADADLILFNTCSIREAADNRFIAHLGEAKRLKSENPERVVGRRRLLGAVGEGRGLRALPVRRRRLRPGPDRSPRRVPDLGLAQRPGLLRVRGLRRRPADAPRARVPGLVADLTGLQLPLFVLHRAVDTWARAEPRPGRAGRRGRAARGRRRARAHPAGPEREQLRARPRRAPDELRRAARATGRRRRDRADPLHQPAPQGHARGRDPRPCRARVGL